MKRLIKASMLLMVAALFAACASEDIAQDKKKENGTEAPKGGVIFAANGPKASAKRLSIDGEEETASAKTRTNIKHTVGQGADAYWTSDDFIWVKDRNGTWQKSLGTTLHDGGTSAEFTLPGSKTDYADGCEVRYTGNSLTSYSWPAASDRVGFPKEQSRTAPNDFSKAGDCGDCGSGIARNTGNPDKFNFTLAHKSSYLCFLPRCENAALAPNIRLKGIKITSDQIFLSYIHDFDGEHLTEIGYPQLFPSINVTLPDFPLYTDARQEDNATYLVVPPGTHNLQIEYTIKDPTTNVETVVTQTLTNKTFDKGNIYDITADLAVPKLNMKYYMWDAQQDYWHGYESEQPSINKGQPGATQGLNYPKNNSDPKNRWYNENYPGHGIQNDAQTNLFKTFPNINELCWYVMKGDPHWGSKTYVENGHLKKIDGLWLRKKSAIVTYLKAQEGYPSSFTEDDLKSGYKASFTASLNDYRITNGTVSATPASGVPTNIADYFFLPASGYYFEGWLVESGFSGYYWTSSGHPWSASLAYKLVFAPTLVRTYNDDRNFGYSSWPSE